MQLTPVTARTQWRSVLHVRIPPNCARVFCFIAGFGQPMSSWRYILDEVMTDPHDGVVIIGRRCEADPGYVALTSLSDQVEEVDAALNWLTDHSLRGLQIILVGHSVGGLIAREVAVRHLEQDPGLIQIAPVPSQRFALLRNWSFWKNGGFAAGLAGPMGVVNARGFIPPSVSVRGLFTGKIPETDFWEYYSSLVPDSVRIFVELLLTYDGTKTWNTLKKNLKGYNTIVVAPADKIIPRKRLEAMAGKQGDLRYLAHATPHCTQFASEADRHYNRGILRDAFGIRTGTEQRRASTLRGRG